MLTLVLGTCSPPLLRAARSRSEAPSPARGANHGPVGECSLGPAGSWSGEPPSLVRSPPHAVAPSAPCSWHCLLGDLQTLSWTKD